MSGLAELDAMKELADDFIAEGLSFCQRQINYNEQLNNNRHER